MTDYTLIRSFRRSLSLQIGKSGELIVRAPRLYPLSKIETLIHEKSSWIAKQQMRFQEKTQENQILSSHYFLFGEILPRGNLTDAQIKEISREALRKHIHTSLPSFIEGKEINKSIANIRINSARTRWGSCSSKGNLSFSYRLVAFPRETIDAVILHEVAHLNHPNHSKRFWALLYSWLPDYEAHVAILKKSLPHLGETSLENI